MFILALDALSRTLKQAETASKIKGLVLGECTPRISYIFFADDIIITIKSKQREIYELMNILTIFSITSSQRINVSKSGVIFGKFVPQHIKTQLCNILNMPEWDKPSKYLGILAYWGRSIRPLLLG